MHSRLLSSLLIFKTMKTALKPANYYASVAIPDYVEHAIALLSRHDLYNFAEALIESMRDRCWSSEKELRLPENVDEWMDSQSVDTFRSLHKWLSNELI